MSAIDPMLAMLARLAQHNHRAATRSNDGDPTAAAAAAAIPLPNATADELNSLAQPVRQEAPPPVVPPHQYESLPKVCADLRQLAVEAEQGSKADLSRYLNNQANQLHQGFTAAEKAESNRFFDIHFSLQFVSSENGSIAMAMAQDGKKGKASQMALWTRNAYLDEANDKEGRAAAMSKLRCIEQGVQEVLQNANRAKRELQNAIRTLETRIQTCDDAVETMKVVDVMLELSEKCNVQGQEQPQLNLPQKFWANHFGLWFQFCKDLHPMMKFWDFEYFGRTILNFKSYNDIKALHEEPEKLLGILRFMKSMNYTAKKPIANRLELLKQVGFLHEDFQIGGVVYADKKLNPVMLGWLVAIYTSFLPYKTLSGGFYIDTTVPRGNYNPFMYPNFSPSLPLGARLLDPDNTVLPKPVTLSDSKVSEAFAALQGVIREFTDETRKSIEDGAQADWTAFKKKFPHVKRRAYEYEGFKKQKPGEGQLWESADNVAYYKACLDRLYFAEDVGFTADDGAS